MKAASALWKQIVAGLVCLGVADVVLLLWVMPAQPLEASTPAPVVAARHPGDRILVNYPVQNHSLFSVRIVGANAGCSTAGCASVSSLPITVGPWQSVTLPIEFHCGNAGQHQYTLDLFTDSAEQPRVPLPMEIRVGE